MGHDARHDLRVPGHIRVEPEGAAAALQPQEQTRDGVIPAEKIHLSLQRAQVGVLHQAANDPIDSVKRRFPVVREESWGGLHDGHREELAGPTIAQDSRETVDQPFLLFCGREIFHPGGLPGWTRGRQEGTT